MVSRAATQRGSKRSQRMIVELMMYTLHPGELHEFMSLYEAGLWSEHLMAAPGQRVTASVSSTHGRATRGWAPDSEPAHCGSGASGCAQHGRECLACRRKAPITTPHEPDRSRQQWRYWGPRVQVRMVGVRQLGCRRDPRQAQEHALDALSGVLHVPAFGWAHATPLRGSASAHPKMHQ